MSNKYIVAMILYAEKIACYVIFVSLNNRGYIALFLPQVALI